MENRTFSRFLALSAKIEATVEFNGKAYQGWLKDVSLHGVFVSVSAEIPRGAEVEVTMWLEGKSSGSSVKCRGVVVRAADSGVGVEIRDMSKEAFTYYRSMVANICRDPEKVESELRQFVNPRG